MVQEIEEATPPVVAPPVAPPVAPVAPPVAPVAPPVAPVAPPVQEQQVTPLSMKSLLEAGVHFGHQRRRWNPKMRRYIFSHRNGIHIIDLQQTLKLLQVAKEFVTEVAAAGEKIIFVGTKKQAQDTIVGEARRSGSFYVATRWLGGTLTNFKTIQVRLDYLVKLEERKAAGEFQRMPKIEALRLEEQLVRLNRYFGGIKELTEMPGALFVVDIGKEAIAVQEARRKGVPVVALVDSDTDPNLVDYPIPGNDDAIRSIRLVSTLMADAVIEGINRRESLEAESQGDPDSDSPDSSVVAETAEEVYAGTPEPDSESTPSTSEPDSESTPDTDEEELVD